MKRITFYFDFISPYAYLAFERLPQVLAGLSHEVRYQPVLLAGMLSHFGQKGPAEIEPKRAWTFRHVAWMAHQHGIPMQVPAEHPFNPLGLLRLALAASAPGHTPNRWVCEQIFHHVWRSKEGSSDANDPQRLTALTACLAQSMQLRGKQLADPQSEPIKQALKQATQEAISRGVFGVPHAEVDGRLYFGLEGLDLLSAALRGEPWFNSGAWEDAAVVRPGVSR